MIHSTFDFTSEDGLKLVGRIWQSEKKHPKGIIYLIHGLGEHSGRYDHVAEAFTNAGYHMAAFDLRGHGLSEGKRGHALGLNTFLDDINVFRKEVGKHLDTSLPAFIYGHSLGGLIVINYGLAYPEGLAGAIATDPAFTLAFTPSRVMWFIANIMAKINPTFTASNELDVNALSRDAAVVKAYQDDALVHDRITASHVVDMIRNGKQMLERAKEWTLPLLLMYGTEDHITSAGSCEVFAENATSDVTLVPWEGYYHEIHNDIGKEQVLEKMVSWMDEPVN